jgi:hypothetical protein
MPATDGTASRRDVENELYDFGFCLVEAAAGIARVAADPDAARAVPALLGCIEAALAELHGASIALQRMHAASSPSPPSADALERGYTNLAVALQDARCASHAARALAARRTPT